jgi:hypothetical protein
MKPVGFKKLNFWRLGIQMFNAKADVSLLLVIATDFKRNYKLQIYQLIKVYSHVYKHDKYTRFNYVASLNTEIPILGSVTRCNALQGPDALKSLQ